MHKFKSTKKFVSLVLAVMMVLSCVAVGVSAASTVKVAFTNNKGWNQVGVYAWDTNGNALLGDWPGTRLTNPTQNDFGEDVYVAEIPSNASNIIFNDNTANGAQTADIDFDGQSKGYYPDTQDGSGHWVCGTWAWTPDDQGQGQGQQGTTVQGTTATVDTTNTKTVYFTNNKGWSNVKAYAWNAQDAALLGEWPGTAATKAYTNDFGEDVYKVTLPAAAVGVVFNGNGGQSNDKQTADITPANNTGYYPTQQNGEGKWEVGSWPVVDNDETTVPGTTVPGPSVTTPVGTKTVYFTNNKGWSDVKAYAWNAQDAALLGEWPGTSATKAYTNDFGEDVYKVTLPAAAVGVVFNGNGGQSNDKQTADITPANNTGYYPTQQNGEGKWEVGSWPVVDNDETTVPGTTVPGPSVTTPVGTKTVYFTNNKGWSDVKAYAWNAQDAALLGEWPGTAATKAYTNDFGEDVYKVTLPAAAVGVVFNGNGGQSNDKQTADITPANNTGYYPTQQNGEGKWEVGSWPVVDNDETTVPGTTVPGPSVTTPVGTKTVYFTNNKGWSDVKAYAWNAQDAALLGEWPGTSATKAYTNDFGEDVYKVTLPAAAVGVVFNGNGGQSNDKQTADITPADNTGYYPTQQNGEGKWEVGSWPVVVETTAQTTTVEESSVQTTTVEETTVQETTVEETTAPGPIELPTDVPAEAIYVANFKPNSYSISLKDSIAINFRVNAATVLGYTNPYLVVTMNGQETVINDYETLSDGTLVFAFDKVYPQTVIDDATAVLHGFKGDQEYYGDNYTRSVLQYCVNNQTKVGNPNSLKGLLVNLLQYAGEAQKYMHYKENTLASDPANINSTAKRYAKQTLTSEDLTSVKNFNAEPLAGTPTSEFTAATLVLGNTVGIKVTFKATDLTNKAIRVDFNGATTYFSGEDLVQGSEGKATFTYPLYATQFNDTVKFTVCDGTTPISDTMTYSVASYAGKYIEPLNETFGPLLKSMMLYGKQAKTYATEAAA